jgi:hypothetical protein
MRADMYKVIVERPRRGSHKPNNESRSCLPPSEIRRVVGDTDDYDGGPTRLRGKRSKSFNEHLAPFKRFLRAQVGRPWNKVYAEICASIDRRSATGLHVLQHIQDFVASRVIEMEGVLYQTHRFRLYPVTGIYVHPRTGILCVLKSKPRVAPKAKAHELVRSSDTLEFRKLDGLWFRLEYRLTDPGSEEFQRLGRRVLTVKRQCDTKTIRRLEMTGK